MAMQIGMGFGKFLARVLFQELGVSVPSSVFHVLFNTVSTCDHPNAIQQTSDAMRQSIEAMQRRGIPAHRSYPHSGYERQGGPCSESASLTAPPQWRGEGGAPIHDMRESAARELAGR